jgi:hypothetical protein
MFESALKKLKDFFGENNELVQSTQGAVNDRITSPFYGYFLIAWLLVNWRFLYAAFFINEDVLFAKKGLLRDEYINLIFPHTVVNLVLYSLLIPIGITFLFFWLFPYGTRIFYRKSIKNQKALRIIELQEMQQEKREEKKLVKEELEILETQVQRAKQEKIVGKDKPEFLWDREFSELKKSKVYENFKTIYELIYSHDGIVEEDYGIRNISVDALAYAHSNGLLEYKSGTTNIVALTDKGKYFVKLYLTEVNRIS